MSILLDSTHAPGPNPISNSPKHLLDSASGIGNSPHSLIPNVEFSLRQTDKRSNKISINDGLQK
jgi:hypothetical protein